MCLDDGYRKVLTRTTDRVGFKIVRSAPPILKLTQLRPLVLLCCLEELYQSVVFLLCDNPSRYQRELVTLDTRVAMTAGV